MSNDALLSRDEVLGGLPAKRAANLLFLIESRTAHLVDRARRAMSPFRSEDADHERELAFVEAFALGRKPPLRPTIQDLERHAPEWADLVPDNPRIRAAVAHLLGGKYQFTQTDVPRLRSVLGLDSAPVQDAYQRLHGTSLDTIYTRRPSILTRIRWGRASLRTRLESLPPFWTAYSLTLTEIIGSSVLALPIAFAAIGPLPGMTLLILVGLINVITVAWMAEATSRTASIRYGGAYFGRMVREYLGNGGASLLTLALIVHCVTALLAYAVGLSATLSGMFAGIDALWVAIVFGIAGLVIWRGTPQSGVASAIGFGGIELVLLLALASIGLFHANPGNLTHMTIPGIDGHPFDLSLLGLVFGVILVSYFGHTSVGNCGAIVLQRDPSGRALVRGVIAAQITTIAVYAIWILAMNGALTPAMMQGNVATVLDPLAALAGSSVHVLGVAFVIIAMGMGLTGKAEVLVNVVHDLIPRRAHPVVLLPRGQGRLVFEPRDRDPGRGPGLVLTYRGLSGKTPRLRLEGQANGRTWRRDHVSDGTWTARDVLGHLPEDVLADLDLLITCLDAGESQVRLRVTTGMHMRYEGNWTAAGLDLAGLLDIDGPDADPDGTLLRWILRQGGVSLRDAAAWAGVPTQEMETRLQGMVERGALRETEQAGTTIYRTSVARRRARYVPDGLATAGEATTGGRAGSSLGKVIHTMVRRLASWAQGDRARRMVEYSPLIAVAVFAEWLVVTNHASFAELLSFSGTIAIPIFAGIFPALLLVSSRRKGDLVPDAVSRLLGRPWLTAGVYAFFLVSILVHGLVIWDQPIRQLVAIGVAIVSTMVTVQAIRHGAFNARTVVSLREDQRREGGTVFEVVSRGEHPPADARLAYLDREERMEGTIVTATHLPTLRRITTTLATGDQARDIKVWAMRVSPLGDVESLPASVRLVCGEQRHHIDLGITGGQVIVPGMGTPCSVEMELDQPSAPTPEPPKKRRARKAPVDVHALLAAPEPDALSTKGT